MAQAWYHSSLLSRDTRWVRGTFLAGLGLVIAVACAPDYEFVPDKKAEHCSNEIQDAKVGETGIDCGGDCRGCGLGEGCADQADCAEGQCIDGFCQTPGCDDGEKDGEETGVDCGGDMCKGCG